MAILKGTDIMLFIKDGTNYKSIAYATNHTLTIGSNSSEVSTKDDAEGIWQSAVVQKLNWSATTENLYSLDGSGATYDDLFTLMIARTPVTVKFGLESSYTNKTDVPADGWTPITTPIYTGDAYITDLSWNNPNADNSSFTATFTGTGALVKS
jgi:TP901-1 family phage major tail protein